MKNLDRTADSLVVVGAINWGLVVLNFNLVEWLSTTLNIPVLSNILYGAIGIAGVMVLWRMMR